MKEENFRCAVECYTKAIELDLRNAVYYCNRYLNKQHDLTRCVAPTLVLFTDLDNQARFFFTSYKNMTLWSGFNTVQGCSSQ